MSRVCKAKRPNSPNKDCCRRRYGSSSRVTSVATFGADIDSFPGGADMELFRQIEVAAPAAKKDVARRRWDGRDFADGTVPRRLWAERPHSCCANGGYQFVGRISANIQRRLAEGCSMTKEQNVADVLGEALVEKCQKIRQEEALIWSH
jgi:hypothetical protein